MVENIKFMPIVAIIVLNWNGWKDTIECLESLYRINYRNYNIIVVDNGSEDESIEKIKKYCKGKIEVKSKFFKYDSDNKPIEVIEYSKEEIENNEKIKFKSIHPHRKMILIKNDKNYGFAEGNNIGIKFALKSLNPDYLLLLNNDIVVDMFFLDELIKIANSNEKIACAGPKVYYYDFKGRKDIISFAGGKLKMWKGKTYQIGVTEIDKGQYDKKKEVDYIEGSCLLIKREIIEQIGLLNSSYFCYWEETDLCLRIKKTGYLCIYCPKAKIWHKVSQSSKRITGFNTYHMTRNMFWCMRKHINNKQLILFLLYYFGYEFWYLSSAYIFYHKNLDLFISYIKGVANGLLMVY